MATTYSKILYGWQVTTSNQALPFDRGGVDKNATLRLGVYTPAEFATEVERAMNAADAGQTYTCTFSFSTEKFTIANGANFALEFSRSAVDCFALLGFANADTAAAASHESPNAVGAGTSTMTSWTLADPNTFHTPVTAQAAGAACLRGDRVIRTVQNKSDGGTVDTVYFGADKTISIAFDMLTSAEATKMEAFLDWCVQGRRFTWQPDSTSANYINLVMVDPSQVNPAWSWQTRPEISYGTLKFIEQVRRS